MRLLKARACGNRKACNMPYPHQVKHALEQPAGSLCLTKMPLPLRLFNAVGMLYTRCTRPYLAQGSSSEVCSIAQQGDPAASVALAICSFPAGGPAHHSH